MLQIVAIQMRKSFCYNKLKIAEMHRKESLLFRPKQIVLEFCHKLQLGKVLCNLEQDWMDKVYEDTYTLYLFCLLVFFIQIHIFRYSALLHKCV